MDIYQDYLVLRVTFKSIALTPGGTGAAFGECDRLIRRGLVRHVADGDLGLDVANALEARVGAMEEAAGGGIDQRNDLVAVGIYGLSAVGDAGRIDCAGGSRRGGDKGQEEQSEQHRAAHRHLLLKGA